MTHPQIHAPAAATTTEERPERVLTFGDVFGRDAGGLIVLLILFGAMTLASSEFLTGENLANLARQVAVFGIIAVGQLLVILTAGIDLSVGSVLGLTGCVSAELLVHGWGIVPAIVVGLLIGAAIGMSTAPLLPTSSCRRSSSRSACSALPAAWCWC
jgi:ribose transport system permease protein